jgi:hypothetical protein
MTDDNDEKRPPFQYYRPNRLRMEGAQEDQHARRAQAFGAMATGAGARRPDTAPAGRVCAECSTILSVYNLSERCSLHRGAREADRYLLRAGDPSVMGWADEMGYEGRQDRQVLRDDW